MAQSDIGTPVTGYTFSVNPSPIAPAFNYLGLDYAFLCSGNELGPNAHVHAFSAPDQATWTELDAAAAPNIGAVTAFGQAYCICRDGDTVYLVYVRAHFSVHPIIDGLTVIKFDLSTGLWGASTNYSAPVIDFWQVPGGSFSGVVQINLVRRGAGDMVLFYSGPVDPGSTNGFARVYYATFDGSTFGSGVKLPAQTGSVHSFYPNGAAVDSSGVTHFLYQEAIVPFPGGTLGENIWHISMDLSGSFGSPELVSDAAYPNNQFGISAPVVFTSGGNEYLGFSALINNDPAFALQSQRFFYAQLSGGIAGLTWLNSTVTTGVYGTNDPNIFTNQGFSLVSVPITVNVVNSKVVVAWIFQDNNTLDGFIYSSTATFPSLAWSAASALITTSLPFTAAYQVGAWQSANSVGIVSVSVRQGNPDPGSEVGQSNFVEAAGSPIGISCGNPPGGQVGLNYSHAFPASGGTPPYTFAIIAGQIPEGLTLNSATGVLSGIPQLNGDFVFTIRATDSLSSSASVTCEIIIIGIPQIAGGMGCLPECFDYCSPSSVESIEPESMGGDPAIIAGILGALMLGGGA